MAYPMPGQTDFTAQEEQQMRQSQADINALRATATGAAPPVTAAQNPNNAESGLNPLATGVGKALGGAVFGGGGGGGGDVSAGNIGGTGGDLGGLY
jgi:hypothetical protein